MRTHGKPDFFVTMTANPKWPEISQHLRAGELTQNRPDLVARVFSLKFKALMHELLQGHILGVVVAYTWVIEFQKRGLPHAHVLLIMGSEDKAKTPGEVDARVCAELPDQDNPCHSELLRIILDCQVHGPCGPRNPRCPCMENGACQKGYPK